MAFPTVLDALIQVFTSSNTSHNVAMPATVGANNALLVLIQMAGNVTITTPGGWTSLGQVADSTPSSRMAAFGKVAVGDEDGTTVDFVSASACKAASNVYQISSWFQDLAGIAIATGGSNNHDPPSLSPSWGALDTLWIITASQDGNIGVNAGTVPTDYGNRINAHYDESTLESYVDSARREFNSATDNPVAWGNSAANFAFTLAIRPSAGGGGGTIKGRRTLHMLGTRMGSRTL